MNIQYTTKRMKKSLVLAAALTLAASPALARVDLVASQGQWTPQGGSPITMWGFALDTGQVCDANPQWTVGPEITDTDLQPNGNLRIRLRNCLSEAVSIIIPGQKAIVVGSGASQTPQPVVIGGRITSFTQDTPPGGVVDYLWHRVRQDHAGTYLYMSGSHPAKQVQMGLYGALQVGQYADTSGDVTLLYSEIDPALHDPTPTTATPLTYKPKYYLVNGQEEATLPAGNTSLPTVLSFLNAGLDFHVPTLKGGYMSLQAEDGNPYPFAKVQYSVNLAAGKTIEAFWQPTSEGEHVLYDRRGNNMVARLTVGTGGVTPSVARDDAFTGTEDTLLAIAAPGVLTNDDPGLEAELVSGPAAGTLNNCPADSSVFLCPDGSFEYVPAANANGPDSFTYRSKTVAGTPNSNTATVTITINGVNDMPTATADTYVATVGVALTVAIPGVLGNDSDLDGDGLTVSSSTLPGWLADGSFSITAPVTGTWNYDYTVCDNGTPQLCASADVVVTVENDTPVAVDDTATVKRNSSPGTTDNGDPAGSDRNTFSLIANDSDANGIAPTSLVLGPTSRGGTVVANADGTVAYTPPRRFRGTDTFTYTVQDTVGALSNEATVRVNVVKRRDLPQL
ncbi:MAG: tandem-95 repeat protein [Gammaproteobacteria bacterium]|nr:tandem-95 repeat protein [Gammaproteobacteria bacterium]